MTGFKNPPRLMHGPLAASVWDTQTYPDNPTKTKMMTTDKVDKFGKFIVENCRDKGINYAIGLLQEKWKVS
jgi:hypothetical protein